MLCLVRNLFLNGQKTPGFVLLQCYYILYFIFNCDFFFFFCSGPQLDVVKLGGKKKERVTNSHDK